jgi:hypothetical protein
VQLLWYVCMPHTNSRTNLNISPLERLSIDLTYNTHLRCVELRFSELHRLSEDVSFAMSTLSRIGSRQLERVAFRIGGRSWRNNVRSTTEWIKVDTILASSQFATLKNVHMYTLPCPPDVVNLSTVPTCHARGIISLVDPSSW